MRTFFVLVICIMLPIQALCEPQDGSFIAMLASWFRDFGDNNERRQGAISNDLEERFDQSYAYENALVAGGIGIGIWAASSSNAGKEGTSPQPPSETDEHRATLRELAADVIEAEQPVLIKTLDFGNEEVVEAKFTAKGLYILTKYSVDSFNVWQDKKLLFTLISDCPPRIHPNGEIVAALRRNKIVVHNIQDGTSKESKAPEFDIEKILNLSSETIKIAVSEEQKGSFIFDLKLSDIIDDPSGLENRNLFICPGFSCLTKGQGQALIYSDWDYQGGEYAIDTHIEGFKKSDRIYLSIRKRENGNISYGEKYVITPKTIYNFKTNDPVMVFPDVPLFNIMSKDEKYLVRVNSDIITIWDVNAQQKMLEWKHKDPNSDVTFFEFHDNDTQLIAGYADNTLQAWDLKTGHSRWLLSDVTAKVINPDSEQMVTISSGKKATLWRLSKPKSFIENTKRSFHTTIRTDDVWQHQPEPATMAPTKKWVETYAPNKAQAPIFRPRLSHVIWRPHSFCGLKCGPLLKKFGRRAL